MMTKEGRDGARAALPVRPDQTITQINNCMLGIEGYATNGNFLFQSRPQGRGSQPRRTMPCHDGCQVSVCKEPLPFQTRTLWSPVRASRSVHSHRPCTFPLTERFACIPISPPRQRCSVCIRLRKNLGPDVSQGRVPEPTFKNGGTKIKTWFVLFP